MKIIISMLLCSFIISCSAQIDLKIQLETYMDAEAEINNFSGTVLVTKNDTILLRKAYGFADYEWETKNTIDAKFSLASVSKQFTAVAILQLLETNKLSLDDKLTKYYPTFPRGEEITIKMLLSHNSGISDDYDELFSSNKTFVSDTIVSGIMKKPLLFDPGTKTSYSNVGYYVLATIIEKCSGKSYSSYLKKYLFDKANMIHSGVSSNDSIFSKMSETYYRKNDVLIKNPYSNWDLNIGHDGVFSTVDDLYLWNKHLFDTEDLLSEETKSLMFSAHNDHDFGLGVVVNPFYNHNHSLIAHDGGYYGTQTSFNKFIDDNVFVTVLSNNGSPSYLIAYGISAMVFGIPVELPYEHIEVQINPKVYADYVGEYEGVNIHVKDKRLYYSNYDIELIPESTTKFFRADNNSRTFEFVRSEKGEIARLILTKAGVKEVRNRTK